MRAAQRRRLSRRMAVVAAALLLAGCRQQMADQPKFKPLQPSAFFADGRSSRHQLPGTVARGQLEADPVIETGKSGKEFVRENPLEVNRALLERGQERFNIYCSPCHDRVGTGEGMIVRRGYRRAASFHTNRLRGIADGYIFDVITHGFGAMPSYRGQVPVHDRWAIIAYIRALQRSQHTTIADLPPEIRGSKLDVEP
jgi:Cytochrome C oxidase, cbb3-type, subunit III